jgi:hypothetical protein
MPMNNDPVLNRPMFSNSIAPTVQPFQAKGTGITSNVVNPDDGAKQLINTFGGAGMAGMSGPGYAGGGSVRHFYEGDVVNAGETDAAAAQRQRMQDLDNFNRSYSEKQRVVNDKNRSDVIERTKQEEDRLLNTPPGGEGVLNIPNKDRISASEFVGAARDVMLPPGVVPEGRSSKSDGANYYEGMAGVDRRAPSNESKPIGDSYNEEMAGVDRRVAIPEPTKKGEEQGPPMPTKAGERDKRAGKGGLDLLLEDIKNRRAASAEEKENNKWMALMQAGLAIMGGRSSNAMQNIGAGGLQGAQAFAASEKDRRAEDRALFGEEAQVRLTQEKLAESADERAAQREMLTSKERERLQERVLEREGRASDRGIAAINAIASQTRQELRDITTAAENIERDIIKYKTTMGIDPNEAKTEIEKLERRRQDLNDRYREVIERQDSILGRQGQKAPDRGPPSLSLPNGGTIRYSGYTAK